MTEADQPIPIKTLTFEFVLLNDYSMLSFISAIEPLRVANRILNYEAYRWRIVSENGGSIKASNGIVSQSEGRVGEGEIPTFTFVCAGLNLIAQHPIRLSAFLNRRYREGCNIGAISMGSIFLARAGLLTERRSTIHWEGEPAFREEFPELEVTRAIYEIDDRIYTCSGGMSSFDLVLALIAFDHDEKVLRTIANQLQLDRIRTGGALQSGGSEYIPATAPKMLNRAITLLQANMENPISLQTLADEIGASKRTLERLFQKHTGMTPSRYCKTQRLERSRDLLAHSNLTITEIALATGFRSTSYFSYCFSEFFGSPPTSLRHVNA